MEEAEIHIIKVKFSKNLKGYLALIFDISNLKTHVAAIRKNILIFRDPVQARNWLRSHLQSLDVVPPSSGDEPIAISWTEFDGLNFVDLVKYARAPHRLQFRRVLGHLDLLDEISRTVASGDLEGLLEAKIRDFAYLELWDREISDADLMWRLKEVCTAVEKALVHIGESVTVVELPWCG